LVTLPAARSDRTGGAAIETRGSNVLCALAKLAEAARPKVSAPATKLALNVPAAVPKEADAKTADDKAANQRKPTRTIAARFTTIRTL